MVLSNNVLFYGTKKEIKILSDLTKKLIGVETEINNSVKEVIEKIKKGVYKVIVLKPKSREILSKEETDIKEAAENSETPFLISISDESLFEKMKNKGVKIKNLHLKRMLNNKQTFLQKLIGLLG